MMSRSVCSASSAIQGSAGHHRDSRHGRTFTRGQDCGVARPQDSTIPESALHRGGRCLAGREGKQVPVAETVRGFKEILDGKHDAVPEGDFYMKGGIDEIKPS